MTKELKLFQINGKYRKEKNEYNFSQNVSAYSEKHAIEKVYSIIGSRHKVKRYNIKILEVKKIEQSALQ
ncbi:MAG: 50S ribosomal protein L18Ae [Candidatus Helarchaeota archaeon]